ncbi:MAG: hypothetical protein Q8Q29_06460 [Actinomycetota bacterium]|nr:hypothetical protein [Actinomycetota bacterium]
MRDTEQRGRTRVLGWLCLAVGLVAGVAGVVMTWDARLHNAIVSNVVKNPWPGYIVTAVGVGLIMIGVVSVARASRS